jgi:putative FmdB family regulatory protein
VPLYDFRCRSCAREFEALVRSGSTPACASCGSADLEQLPSTFAVSSDTMRKANLKAVRSKAAKAREVKVHDEHAAMKDHLNDHHH